MNRNILVAILAIVFSISIVTIVIFTQKWGLSFLLLLVTGFIPSKNTKSTIEIDMKLPREIREKSNCKLCHDTKEIKYNDGTSIKCPLCDN